MNMGFLFETIWQDNDVVQMRVSAWNGIFGGAADVYLGRGQLEEASGTLRDFPTQPSDTREVIFGSFAPHMAGGGVSMRFYCADGAGHAFVDSRIESARGANGKVQSVSLTLAVEPAAVDLFVDELRQLGTSTASMARLRCAA
jgi:hypothetical protein